MKHTILFTGGHITPALAVIEALDKHAWQILLSGRRYAFSESKDIATFEYEESRALGIDWFENEAPRFPRSFSLQAIAFPYRFLRAIFQAYKILRTYHPQVVCTFGGYLAVPYVLAAKCAGIPVVVHEQTCRTGVANRFFARLFDELYIAWPEVKNDFPSRMQQKIIYTGNPLRRQVLQPSEVKTHCTEFVKEKSSLKLIYITGGSTGAHAINKIAAECLPSLLKTYRVIHQCGDSYFHDYEMLKSLREKLPDNLKNRYRVERYIQQKEIGVVMRHADIIVARAGANTITEIAVLAIPTVCIPLPHSSNNEQQANAHRLEQRGSALIIDQEQLTARSLLDSIKQLDDKYTVFKTKAYEYQSNQEIQIHTTAAGTIAHRLGRFSHNERNNPFHTK